MIINFYTVQTKNHSKKEISENTLNGSKPNSGFVLSNLSKHTVNTLNDRIYQTIVSTNLHVYDPAFYGFLDFRNELVRGSSRSWHH